MRRLLSLLVRGLGGLAFLGIVAGLVPAVRASLIPIAASFRAV